MIANFLKVGIAGGLILQAILIGQQVSLNSQLRERAKLGPYPVYTIPSESQIQLFSSDKIYRAPITREELLGSNTSRSDLSLTVSAPGYQTQQFSLSDCFKSDGSMNAPVTEGAVLVLSPNWSIRLFWWSPTLASGLMLLSLAYLRNQSQRAQESTRDMAQALAGAGSSGHLIADRYLLGELLGAGATSQVWKAVDQKTGQTVAFKWLLEEVSSQPELVTRFEREAKICQQLIHPNLIQVLDQGRSSGRLWLVQPWLNAQSLDHLRMPLKQDLARNILLDICSGLAAAHAQGILHRDLKPANILINEDGKAIIIDFGLARSQSFPTITNTEAILGTPAYMAPEQLKGDKSRPESDLYSLGCLAFELVTGRTPFPTEDLMNLLSSHMAKPAPSPSSVLPELGQDWDLLVQSLMRKDPDSRSSLSQASEALRNMSAT
jgi:hypothetical protein